MTNWLSVAEGFTAQQSPAVQWPQVLGHLVSLEKLVPYGRIRIRPIQWQLRPLDPVEGEILKTDSNRPSVPPGHPMVDQQGQFKKGSPNRDHRCGVLPVHRQQYSGLGAHLQELTASGIWSQDQSQLHINVLELQAIWLGLKAFSQRVEDAKVALMSDNTSAVAYLRNQGGTKCTQTYVCGPRRGE